MDDPFEEVPLFEPPPPEDRGLQVNLKPVFRPVWSDHKAALVERYLYLFVQVTHHGTYVDGFAGPQYPDKAGSWTAERVLNIDLLQHFHLFEIDDRKLPALTELRDHHRAHGRDVHVYPADFNEGVMGILRPDIIPLRQATFCLLDQHTFECRWDTLERLAAYKADGLKIELFYFLANAWLDRALAATRDEERIRAWWGRDDWPRLRGMDAARRAYLLADRLVKELHYGSAIPWAIHEKEEGGHIMYFMVHATDHPDAPKLMWRAYREVVPRPPVPERLVIPGLE